MNPAALRQTRRAFLATGALALTSSVVPSFAKVKPKTARYPAEELEEITIAALQRGLTARQYTSVSLVQKYLARIEAIDRNGPRVNSVIELNPDALAIARSLDRERKSGHLRGPLHGIPILIKDNIDTHDRMTTTAGSLALKGSIAPQDSYVAARLRKAGAVLLGKTNLSEWANFRSNRSSSGWSGRGGQTRNPYVLTRNPSGSSAGSGAAVSANLCAGAIGTETDGSIISPSSACGIVGLKPTVGLIGRSGIIPISKTQDTAGPMTRTVHDTALLLNALAGEDPRDERTLQNRGKLQLDYTAFLQPGALRGARIGVLRRLFSARTEVVKVMEQALEVLKSEGAILVDPSDWPDKGGTNGGEFQVLLYEFKDGLNAYFASLGSSAPVHTLEELIQFNEKHRDEELPFFGQETLIEAQKKGDLTSKEYLEALEKCRAFTRDGLDAVFAQHNLSAVISPSFGPAHATDLMYGNRGVPGSSTAAAVAGYPSVTLPAGFVGPMPVGISFTGKAWNDHVVLSLAYAFEQATKVRRAPKFIPDLG